MLPARSGLAPGPKQRLYRTGEEPLAAGFTLLRVFIFFIPISPLHHLPLSKNFSKAILVV